ncbi:DUF1547 domain-containing protein [Candidatus Clavichlamydia salmonicola]|uniref:DUF1547 domain-containing protein n=1 Tax=Candidatus Clavichlamydia salmonicola TaxID=469812 RepID=UPI001890DB94|nr:DUF1547 domain-containing protein [Candidatus Clavichlamydia salmonicola]
MSIHNTNPFSNTPPPSQSQPKISGSHAFGSHVVASSGEASSLTSSSRINSLSSSSLESLHNPFLDATTAPEYFTHHDVTTRSSERSNVEQNVSNVFEHSVNEGHTRRDSLGSADFNYAVETDETAPSSKSPLEQFPTYDPTNAASIKTFLSHPKVLPLIQERNGHYFYVDEGNSRFIFVPDKQWDQAVSIKVTNGKTKGDLASLDHLTMCICKFSSSYKTLESDWASKRAPQIRANLGYDQDTPVQMTHFVLNFKHRMATGYAPFGEPEATTKHSPSVWKRGTKVSVPKEMWDDTQGLQPANLKQGPETPTATRSQRNGDGGKTPNITVSPIITVNPNISPIFNNGPSTGFHPFDDLNRYPGYGNQMGRDDQGDRSSASLDSGSLRNEPLYYSEPGAGKANWAAPNPFLNPTNTNSSSSDSSSNTNPFEGSSSGTDMENQTTSTNATTETPTSNKPSRLSVEDGNNLKDLLGKVRAHLDTVYPADGSPSSNDPNVSLGSIIKGANSSQKETVAPTEESSPKLSATAAKLLTTNTPPIQNATSATVDLRAPANPMPVRPRSSTPSPQTSTSDLEVLQRVRRHLDEATQPNYRPDPSQSIGPIIKNYEQEKKNQ